MICCLSPMVTFVEFVFPFPAANRFQDVQGLFIHDEPMQVKQVLRREFVFLDKGEQ